jgi:hypothetical protein
MIAPTAAANPRAESDDDCSKSKSVNTLPNGGPARAHWRLASRYRIASVAWVAVDYRPLSRKEGPPERAFVD